MKTKTFFLFIAILLIGGMTCNLQGQNCSLTVEIEGTTNANGKLSVGLFNTKESFLSESYSGKKVKASPDLVRVEFEDIEPGEYAIAVIHDENLNGSLDKNFMGIPKEGYGFSNGTPAFGPPGYSEAAFTVNQGKKHTVSIKMAYVGKK